MGRRDLMGLVENELKWMGLVRLVGKTSRANANE